MGDVESTFQVTLTQYIIHANIDFLCAKFALIRVQPLPLLQRNVAHKENIIIYVATIHFASAHFLLSFSRIFMPSYLST
jgi:hypothetical protein